MKKSRTFLLLFLFVTAFAAAQPVARQDHSAATASLNPLLEPFYHGVASGDPLDDRVIIWTRVTPDSTVSGPVIVSWRMALDTGMFQVVASGSQLTDASRDYTVKVDVTGLQANTYYFYEFTALGGNSVRGRTKTTPASTADSLRFAIVTCANYEAGFFNAYKSLTQRNDVDAVLMVGDYIYEYESGGYAPNAQAGRSWQPANEIVSLTDYRTRYSHYRLDNDLMRLHQQYPWICVWDDHESANDSWMNGAENHQANEGQWSTRKAEAIQAYFEWLPVRPPSLIDNQQIFRTISYGTLVDFIVLDTRLHGRDLQDGTTNSNVMSPTRQLLGTDQFTWMANQMDSSNAQWKVLMQQVMVAPLEVFSVGVNGDQWDGYPAERDRLYNEILTNNIHDVVVITGDIHSSWANDLPTSTYNSSTGAGSAGVEFVAPSVTSPGFPLSWGCPAIQVANSHIKYCDLVQHGYVILDFNHLRSQADWYYVATIDSSSSQFSYADSWYVNDLERFLHHGNAAAVPRPDLNHVQAPLWPRPIITNAPAVVTAPGPVLLGLYPNPAHEQASIQYILPEESRVMIRIFDLSGKEVGAQDAGQQQSGLHTDVISMENYAAGTYIVRLETAAGVTQLKIVKE